MLLCLSVNIIVILSPYFYMLEILRVCILGCGILVRNIFALKKCQNSYANTKPPRLPSSAVSIKTEITLTFLFLIGKYWEALYKKKKNSNKLFSCLLQAVVLRSQASGLQVLSSLSSRTEVMHCKGAFNLRVFQYIYEKMILASFCTKTQWVFEVNMIIEGVIEQQEYSKE